MHLDDFTPDRDAQVSDDFYQKLQEKIETASIEDYQDSKSSGRNLAILALFVLVNAGLVWWMSSNNSTNTESTNESLFEEVTIYNY